MKRHREKFEKEHDAATREQHKGQSHTEDHSTKTGSDVKESNNISTEKPEVYFNQVEAVGSMGKNHRLTSTQSDKDILKAAGGKAVKPKHGKKLSDDNSSNYSGDSGTGSKKKKLTINLTQIGTAAAPTARQIAAGFVPITPVRDEVKVAPGSVNWTEEDSEEESEEDDEDNDLNKVDKRFAAVKVDVSDDSVQYDEEEEADDLEELDESGSDFGKYYSYKF